MINLQQLARRGLLRDLDAHFASLMLELAREPSEALALAAGLASQAIGEGNVCIDLSRYAETSLFENECLAPPLDVWRGALLSSGVVGEAGDFTPLVLDGTRLYLHRYWEYERAVADALIGRAAAVGSGIDEDRLRASLARLFPARRVMDWQKVAAAMAATGALTVISGGPGTGKTTTAIKALASMLEGSRAPLRIALAAPTGKAAARLQESLRKARGTLGVPPKIEALMPSEASTVHRLLGVIQGSTRFRHGRDNPLALDALVVDEASMLDLALTAKLLAALPASAQLILLGDKDQLASVEAGAVLASVCAGAGRYSRQAASRITALTGCEVPLATDVARPIADAVVTLRENYRFVGTSGIGRLAAAACAGDAESALDVLRAGTSDLAWNAEPERGSLVEEIAGEFAPLVASARRSLDPVDAFARLRAFGVLCAHVDGPFGTATLNAAVERTLRARGVIATPERWYPGRPVMITRNDYATRLFNGDVGIALPDPADGTLRVFFEGAVGEARAFAPARVPEHETAYAITVHKAQGSEYEHVAVILPSRPSAILTRELVYTAVTRAMRAVTLYARPEVQESAIRVRVERDTGLAARLAIAASCQTASASP